MAVSGVGGKSSMNSIYGNRPVISGLASGMDTESMIENAVAGIKTKITGFQKSRTATEWKQEAYRSVIDKMVKFSQKYTSYSSSTNLFSPSFFNKAVSTVAAGTHAGKVSASGKSSSSVSVDSIRQLATAAQYAVDGMGGVNVENPTISADQIDLAGETDLSKLKGYMSFQYGNKTVSINFDELENLNDVAGKDGVADPKKLAEAITKKLGEQKVTMSDGKNVKASDLIDVQLDATTGKISFADKKKAGNSVYIGDASSNVELLLGFSTEDGNKPSEFTVRKEVSLANQVQTGEYLSGRTLSFNLDGIKKDITMPTYDTTMTDKTAATKKYVTELQTQLTRAYGVGQDGTTPKVVVENGAKNADGTPATDGALQLNFKVDKGSALQMTSSANKALGMEDTATSFLSGSKSLEDLKMLDGLEAIKGVKGDTVDKDGYKLDADGNKLYSFQLNGVEVGQYSKDTKLETVMLNINSNTKAGVGVSLSKTSNRFVFTAKETGVAQQMEFNSPLAQKMFGTGSVKQPDGTTPGYTAGKDAILSVTINGEKMTDITRSSNVVDLDGLSVTLKDTFVAGADGKAPEKITFTSQTDADKVVGAIKDMVKDYNEMLTEIKDKYATIPLQKNSAGARYEPLTAEEEADLSESELKSYNERAKTGVLFADKDLSALYEKMRSAISPPGEDGALLRKMGISTSYSAGLTAIELDESKLRDALNSDPDSVREAFTKSKDSGGTGTNGIMQNIKTQMDAYASVSGATKGILVQKAGTPYSSLSLLKNELQDSIAAIDKQTDMWTGRLSDQIDLYTRKFSQLEQLVSQMNSQSSTLMGMMGG